MTGSARDSSRSARWAWIAAAFTPVGFALVVLLGFALGEGSAGTAAEIPASVLAHLLGVAAPTAAVVLALAAWHGGARSGRAAVIVSTILLAGMFVALPILGTTFALGWVIALVIVATVVALAEWRTTVMGYRRATLPDLRQRPGLAVEVFPHRGMFAGSAEECDDLFPLPPAGRVRPGVVDMSTSGSGVWSQQDPAEAPVRLCPAGGRTGR